MPLCVCRCGGRPTRSAPAHGSLGGPYSAAVAIASSVSSSAPRTTVRSSRRDTASTTLCPLPPHPRSGSVGHTAVVPGSDDAHDQHMVVHGERAAHLARAGLRVHLQRLPQLQGHLCRRQRHTHRPMQTHMGMVRDPGARRPGKIRDCVQVKRHVRRWTLVPRALGRRHARKAQAHGHTGTRAHRHTGTRAHGHAHRHAHRHTGTQAQARTQEARTQAHRCRREQ
jgi:hypothetical protein